MFFRKGKVGLEYYFERGKECLDRGDYRWALESFNKAIEFNPNFEMAYYMRAEVYKKLGKDREAVWDCIRFLEADRRTPGTAQDLKEALREGINVARMESQRNKMKAEILSFGVPILLEELIDGYDPEEEYKDTRFYGIALSWLEGNSPRNWCHIGFVQLLRKNLDDAIKGFDEAIKENPEDSNAHYFMGITLSKKIKLIKKKGFILGGLEKAEELSKEAISSFHQALKRGKWRICVECGWRTASAMNYCMRCGKILLSR